MKSRLVIAFVSALALAGCGADSSLGDKPAVKVSAETKELFVSKCGGCHTLDDAGTTGSSGPVLDGRNYDSVRVAAQVENGGGGMPAGLLEGADVDAVADYVAKASA